MHDVLDAGSAGDGLSSLWMTTATSPTPWSRVATLTRTLS